MVATYPEISWRYSVVVIGVGCVLPLCPNLQDMFDQVKKEEFKVPGGEGGLAETFFNPEREGWLTKEGGKYKSKHKRWFILKEGMLYYFKQANVHTVHDLIVLFCAWLPALQ